MHWSPHPLPIPSPPHTVGCCGMHPESAGRSSPRSPEPGISGSPVGKNNRICYGIDLFILMMTKKVIFDYCLEISSIKSNNVNKIHTETLFQPC